jgi:hypothetical protein
MFTVAAVAFLVLLISGCSGSQTVRCTTWNLQWFPNGSANEATAAQQDQRIKEEADVLRSKQSCLAELHEQGIIKRVGIYRSFIVYA